MYMDACVYMICIYKVIGLFIGVSSLLLSSGFLGINQRSSGWTPGTFSY